MKAGKFLALSIGLILIAGEGVGFADGWTPDSRASNTGSIANTRHNLSLSFAAGLGDIWQMDTKRNQYGEVCVYCHTPHGANSQLAAPLWNRTKKNTTYTLYNIPLMSGQAPTQPGVNSLTCLSCHDGTTAVDSIINMPGSGRYLAAQETAQSNAFLNTWPGASAQHLPIGLPAGDSGVGCLEACHNASNEATWGGNPPGPKDFKAFMLDRDLRNDHPVGVQLPDTVIYDFHAPNMTAASMKFFDNNANSRADNNEVRFYDTGEGYEVECASCHDPHGVESAGQGSVFIPSFLRVSNAGSALCLTCHDK